MTRIGRVYVKPSDAIAPVCYRAVTENGDFLSWAKFEYVAAHYTVKDRAVDISMEYKRCD